MSAHVVLGQVGAGFDGSGEEAAAEGAVGGDCDSELCCCRNHYKADVRRCAQRRKWRTHLFLSLPRMTMG